VPTLWSSRIWEVQGDGRQLERGNASDSISGFVQQSSLAWAMEEEHCWQAESSSPNYSFTVEQQNSRLEEGQQSTKTTPHLYSDLKDLPLLRDVVLKDITNETLENLKNGTTLNNLSDEEVNSGWQLFFQEQQ
jgi:hypothetical protein